MRTPIAAALTGLLLLGQAVAGAPTPEARMVAAAAALEKYAGDFGTLDGKPGDIAAWNGLWAAVQAYVADRLDQQTNPKVIEKQAPPLSTYYSGLHIVAIGKDLYAVSASAGPLGNAFLIGKRNDRFATLWDIRQSAMGNTAWGWNAEAAKGQCSRCRATSGTVYALSPDSTGRARFYIDAAYAQEMGATFGSQISFWSWDGKEARLLLKKDYVSVADDLPGLEPQGDLVKVHSKSSYRTLFACGSCSGRKLTWTLRARSDRIEDLGQTVDIPEMDTVDEVFFRLWYNKTADDLADPNVLKTMRGIVAMAKANKFADPKNPYLGMLVRTTAARRGGETVLDVVTDNDPAPAMHFTVRNRKSGFYLARLAIPQK